MKKGIAFFDFDGTITTKDTLLEFIKYCRGNLSFYFGFLLNSPWLVAYKLKIISNQAAKEKVLGYFFNNMPVNTFNNYCEQFAVNLIPRLIRPAALNEINKLKQSGTEVAIVSASPGNWVAKWANKYGLQTIATVLTEDNDRISGRISGKNCHGEEKVRRIKEQYALEDYTEIYAYGDSPGDKPMLKLATHAFYKPFR